ncbi:MAG: serpin family protein [Gudongella sp.]|nr:serpin family protein [Gudongella sp.]
MKKSILTVTLLLSIVFTACAAPISKNSSNLMDNIQKSDLVPIDISDTSEQQLSRKEEITDFSLKLFKENFEDKNILISPISIVSALGMVANGANDNTFSEMEEVLNSDIQGLNDYLKAYTTYLPSSEKYKVSLANSIWFKDDKGLNVNRDFLQINKDYYDASVYKAAFDKSTKDDINAWVKDKTNGMIETLLEEAPPKDAVMYLINALSFDAEWENIYENIQINDGEFTLENGEKQAVEFMSSSEFSYLENETVTGFMKPYKDNKYAFVALLPKGNILMVDLLKSIEAKDLISLVENKKDEEVHAKIPKFSMEFDTLLNDTLQSLGILDAFDEENADFTSLGKSVDGNIYISRVIHKTKIDLDERGTKAGAVTAVEMVTESAIMEESKKVILDRPFFFMIVDTEQNLPLFMGSLMSVN